MTAASAVAGTAGAAVVMAATDRGRACAGRHIQNGAAVEKAFGAQLEADRVDGHDGPVLYAWKVRETEGVPHDDVLTVDVTVLGNIGRQAAPAGVLVYKVAGGVTLVLRVPGDPEVFGGECGTACDRGRGVSQQRGLVL